MSTSTPNLGLHKPDSIEVVNVETDLNDNFDVIDDLADKVDGLLFAPTVQEADSSVFNDTELVLASVTKVLPKSGRNIRVRCKSGITSDIGSPNLRLRYKAGAAAEITGSTEIAGSYQTCAIHTASGFNRVDVDGVVSNLTAGEYTFFITGIRNSADGTIAAKLLGSATNKRVWEISDVGDFY